MTNSGPGAKSNPLDPARGPIDVIKRWREVTADDLTARQREMRRMADATRAVIDRLMATKAPREALGAAADELEAISAELGRHPYGSQYEGVGEAADEERQAQQGEHHVAPSEEQLHQVRLGSGDRQQGTRQQQQFAGRTLRRGIQRGGCQAPDDPTQHGEQQEEARKSDQSGTRSPVDMLGRIGSRDRVGPIQPVEDHGERSLRANDRAVGRGADLDAP